MMKLDIFDDTRCCHPDNAWFVYVGGNAYACLRCKVCWTRHGDGNLYYLAKFSDDCIEDIKIEFGHAV